MMQYDVAIVGTGPAGGTAACRLAETGLTAVLVEKDKLPRSKACGGALSPRVRRLLDWNIDELIEAETCVQHYQFSSSQECVVKETPTAMLLVERGQFDQHFVTRALDTGEGRITLRQGVTIQSACEDEQGVTLSTTSGDSIRARYVIAADGAVSHVARSLGLFRRAAGAAIDAAVVVEQSVFERERNHATFDVDCVANGYGWSFPKSDHLSCGIGIWHQPRGLKPHLQSYLDRSFPPGAIKSITKLAHPVPVFQGHNPISSGRTCLVGDAAHLVDPVVGEGIVYAIESGRLAADVITSLCRGEAAPSTNFDPGNDYTGSTGDITGLFDRYRDCRVYQNIIRNGIARRLNLVRLAARSQFLTPLPLYGALPST